MSDRATPWLAIARYDAAGRARGSAVATGLLSAFLLLFLAFFPSLATADVDLDAYVEAFPPALREAFGIIAISSIEGFLAVEFYQFAWLLLVGLYLAYLAGGTIAGDVASGRMDLTLSAPVARRDVVIGRFLGLVPLVVLLNVLLPIVAYVGVVAVGETIAVEFYQFAWLLLVGLYLAYIAGGTIAGDVASGRMDLTLSAPVARRDVVVGRFLGLVPLVALLNLVLPVVAYVGVLAVGETIAVERLVAVHALAVPYHLTCVAVGIAVSTLVSRPGIAQRVALGALFALFMFESVVASTEFSAAADVSPTAHYDPSAVLVLGEYDLAGAAILTAAAAVLVALAVVRFRFADLSG